MSFKQSVSSPTGTMLCPWKPKVLYIFNISKDINEFNLAAKHSLTEATKTTFLMKSPIVLYCSNGHILDV